MKFQKMLIAVGVLGCLTALPQIAKAYDLALTQRMYGRILLQVQSHGEAWYVRDTDKLRYYMKDGDAAYQMMRNFSQGITDADLAKIPHVADTTAMNQSASICTSNALANRLKGKILLQVQQHGEAWYVHPVKCRSIYMADGAAAYQIMRYLGFGIANTDLDKIQIGNLGGAVPPPVASGFSKTVCTVGSVSLPNYGDPGKRLANCFVEYPGEPTRQDKSYYIVEDICGQFTKEFIQNALGMSVYKLEASTDYNNVYCKYFTSPGGADGKNVMLTLNYSGITNWNKNLRNMGQRVEGDTRIPMLNYAAWQDSVAKSVSLVLWSEKFISVTQSSDDILPSDRMVEFAANIAKEIKNYK